MLSSIVLTTALLIAAPPDVRFASGVVASAFAAQHGVSVVTNDDVRRALDVEADKQTAGCQAEASCLSEIAAALDARLVVTGAVTGLENGGYLIDLSVFDARAAASVVRESSRAPAGADLVAVIEERAWRLAAASRERFGVEPLRVLVLDVESRGGLAPPQATLRIATVVAGGLATVGALSLVGGAAADNVSVSTFQNANQSDVDARAMGDAVAASRSWALGAVIGYGLGVALMTGAAATFVIGSLE